MSPTRNTAPKPDYDNFLAFLHDQFVDDLRWVASFDATTYDYQMHYIKPGVETELSDREFDAVVHRSVALFRRPSVEEVYAHLGSAQALVIEHERATAVHIYLSDTTGLIIKIRAGNDITVPTFTEACLDELYPVQ